MKCAVHTEVDATGFCRNCGKSLCDQCKHDVQGALYCEACLAALVAKPQPPSGVNNPTLAAILGFIPGVGAVYNGEYIKALLHVVIFGTLITLADKGHAEALFGMLAAAFYFYMPVEAYRTAKAKMEGKPTADLLAGLGAGQPIGAYVLIALGAVMLLDNLVPGFDPWDYVGRFWPVLLIIFGILLLRKRMEPAPPASQEEKRDG